MKKFSRRDFIRVGGAAGVGVLGSSVPTWAKKPTNDYIEALVIGSGFGGAIAALRLAQAGVQTVVLERGRRWPILPNGNTFATFQAPDGRSSWLSTSPNGLLPFPAIDRYAGVLELLKKDSQNGLRAEGVEVRNGAGVGGGSLVYNAIMLQPRRELFNLVFSQNIDYDEMDQLYYPRVRQMLGQSTIPNGILNSGYYDSTKANLLQAQNAGMYLGTEVEYAINWDLVAEEIAGTKVKSAIDGQSWYGLNSGAKNSVDKNYLKDAETTGKVQVVPLHVVTDISESRSDGLYTVKANEIDNDGKVLGQRTFTCRYLFMAAGSTGTSALLTKARDKRTLPRLNKHVGRYWGGNGDFIALRGGMGGFAPAQGGPCGHIFFEDAANPVQRTHMVELVIPKDFHQIALRGAPGFSLYVGLGIAPALGYLTYDPATDSTTLNWPNLDPRLDQFSAGVNSMLNRLNAANPTGNLFPPPDGSFNAFNSEDPGYKGSGQPALTAHPLGGAVLGKVCDPSGRVHGHPGLYVVDGAMIPGGNVGGCNPAWTIAALAERSMDKIISRDIGNGSRFKFSGIAESLRELVNA